MNSIQVCLRDRSVTPCTFLVETESRDANDSPIEDGDLCDCEAALNDFTARAREIQLPHENFDIYIGFWGDQGTIEFPPDFLKLIVKRGWKVTFDIND